MQMKILLILLTINIYVPNRVGLRGFQSEWKMEGKGGREMETKTVGMCWGKLWCVRKLCGYTVKFVPNINSNTLLQNINFTSLCVISYLIIYTAYYPSLKNFWEDLLSVGRFFWLSYNGKYCTQGLLALFFKQQNL